AGCAAAFFACAAMLFLFDPALYPFYPVCVFHRLTGLNCPGCGTLRALHELVHGHPLNALRDNPLTMLSVPVVSFFSVRYLRRWFAGQPLRLPDVGPSRVLLLIGVLVGFTILRNLPFAPFIYLSPP